MQGLFRISERAHSGLILMTQLAERFGQERYLTLKEVAESMRLSEGYLEEVAASLKAAGLIVGRTGPKGGYALARDPGNVTAEDIVTALEGPLALVDCQTGAECPVAGGCSSRKLWNLLQKNIATSLRGVTLEAVAK